MNVRVNKVRRPEILHALADEIARLGPALQYYAYERYAFGGDVIERVDVVVLHDIGILDTLAPNAGRGQSYSRSRELQLRRVRGKSLPPKVQPTCLVQGECVRV